MIDINNWVNVICKKIESEFNQRIMFIGIQGSCGRGDATESSDIDMVVILDKLGIEDLKKYKNIVNSMEYSEKACGFISGAEELKNWNKAELFQFYNDTKTLYGNLNDLVKKPDKNDAGQAVSISVQGLYHAACHDFLYSKNLKNSLNELYKQIFFILQAKYFVKHEEYISSKNQLLSKLDGIEKELMKICVNRKEIFNYSDSDIEAAFCILIKYCSEQIREFI